MIQQVLTALARATLQSKLKVTNQRIAQLAKTFGKNSPIYKREVETLEKGAASKFKGESASGNIKLDMRKITNALKDPNGRNEVNEVLVKIMGVKIDSNGNLQEVAGQGVKTIKQIKKERDRRLAKMGEDASEYSDQEATEMYEEVLNFEDSFEHAYDVAMGRVGESVLKKDPITSKLWGKDKGGTRSGQLTYKEMRDIMNRLAEIANSAQSSALDFEKENGGNR